MAHQSYTKTVLTTALEMSMAGKGEVSCGDVAKALKATGRLERKRCLNTLSDLSIDGKLTRIRQGVYGPVTGRAQPDKREVMWRLLRMRKRVTVEDLVEMAGVSHKYAREWLLMLVKNEVVRKHQIPNKHGVWTLVRDSLAMPVDTEKAEKLRKLRRRQKAEIIGQLDAIDTALADVRQILQTMEEE